MKSNQQNKFLSKRHNISNNVFKEEYNKLKKQAAFMEKVNPITKCIQNLAPESAEANSLLKKMTESKQSRASVKSDLVSVLKQISEYLNTFKSDINNEENIHKLDYDYYKHQVMNLKQRIETFKVKSCAEMERLKSENRYDKTMSISSQLIRELSIRPASGLGIPSSKSSNVLMSESKLKNSDYVNACEETHVFERFISEGGHYGKWSEKDHLMFLKYKQKNANNTALLIRALREEFPDFSSEYIVDHDQWYERYQNLKKRQKVALKKWRERKDLKTKTSNQATNNSTAASKSTRKLSETLKNAKESQQVAKQSRLEIKEKIEAWKLDKAERQKEIAEIDEREKKLSKDKDSLKGNLINEDLIKWQQMKVAKTEEMLLQKELDEADKHKARIASNKILPQFRVQDDIYMQRKLKAKDKANQGFGQFPNMMAPLVTASRDPGRLMMPTEAFRRKSQPLDEAENLLRKDIMRNASVRTIPKLGIPAWRQSVMNV